MQTSDEMGGATAAPPAAAGSAGAASMVESHAGGVVLFDGVCNLCNGFVLFVIDRDPAGRFRFGPLQGEEGGRLMREHGIDLRGELSSVVLLEGGRAYSRSTAALRILRRLGGAWPLLYAFIVVPRPVRDAVYGWVARNRYRWFGQTAQCRIPTPELRGRFLAMSTSPEPR